MIEIRKADRRDVDDILKIARSSFEDTYGWYNPKERIEAYFALHFTQATFGAAMAHPSTFTYVAAQDKTVVGFTHLDPTRRHQAVAGNCPIELSRLYLTKYCHGKGIARQLVEHAEKELIQQGFDTIWLGVWQQNPRAIKFYEKVGFEARGEIEFMFVDDRQTDVLMVKQISVAS